MTIARVVHVDNIDVGLKVHLRNQIIYLKNQGFEVHGVCSQGELIKKDGHTEDGIPVKLVNITPSITPLQDIKAIIQMSRYFRANNFEIVHTHSLKPGLLGRIAARMARVPIVVHTIHGLFFYEDMNGLEQRFWAQFERFGMKFGDYALSQNLTDVDTVIRTAICKPNRIGYLGNGIDLCQFNPDLIDKNATETFRRELGVAPHEKVVSMAGRLIAEKGYLEFFDAAKNVKRLRANIHFWIMGLSQPDRAGALSSDHPAVIEASQYVKFLGYRSDMYQLLAASDIFVLPSHGREGVPRVLMEAAAMQRPIIATDVRGCKDVVQHEVTGLLIPSHNSAELTKAIFRLMDNPEEALKFGLKARELAQVRFHENEYFKKIEYCYRSLLNNELPHLPIVNDTFDSIDCVMARIW